MTVRKQSLWLLVVYLLGLVLVASIDALLPARYFNDHARLLELVQARTLSPGGSFENTALFYRAVFGGEAPRLLVGVLNFTVVIAGLWLVVRATGKAWATLDYAWLSGWVLLSALYVGMYSKEVFTIGIMTALSLAVLRPRNLFLILGSVGAILVYGLYIRLYWILVFLYAIGFWCVFRFSRHKLVALVGVGAVAVAAAVSFRVAIGTYLTATRDALNLGRLDSPDVVTMILNPMEPVTLLADLGNTFYALVGFVAPWYLLVTGAPQHLAFAAWQIVNVVTVLVSLTILTKYSRLQGREDVLARVRIICAVLLGFAFTHAAFEGDFGSYARHQIAIMPLVAALLVSGIVARREMRRAVLVTPRPEEV